MDNDTLHILKALYQDHEIDAYLFHVATKIPPSTLYNVLEENLLAGRVYKKGLVYSLNSSGEKYLSTLLGKELMRPSFSFKTVPEKYSGTPASKDDVSIINIIQ